MKITNREAAGLFEHILAGDPEDEGRREVEHFAGTLHVLSMS